jgi:hypothetical protein
LYLPGHSRQQIDERFGSPHSARDGRLLFRRSWSKSRRQRPLRGIPGSQMKSQRRHGPASGRCRSGISVRKATA